MKLSVVLAADDSPIIHELMRRQCAGNFNTDDSNSVNNENASKTKKKGSWLKNIRSFVAGYKEMWRTDERDTSSDKAGCRSSSATDDSHDLSFHGPERIRVRHFGKLSKDLSALYKNQEMQAHTGFIWSMQFSSTSISISITPPPSSRLHLHLHL